MLKTYISRKKNNNFKIVGNSNFVGNESQSSSFSLKRIFSKYYLWHFRRYLDSCCSIFKSTMGPSFSGVFLPLSPYCSSCSDPWIVVCDLETVWPALPWLGLRLSSSILSSLPHMKSPRRNPVVKFRFALLT